MEKPINPPAVPTRNPRDGRLSQNRRHFTTVKYVNLAALSAAVHLPRKWLREQAESSLIPCLRVGRKLLFHIPAVRSAIAELAAQSRIEPGADELPPQPKGA